jgi:hypothetical protein
VRTLSGGTSGARRSQPRPFRSCDAHDHSPARHGYLSMPVTTPPPASGPGAPGRSPTATGRLASPRAARTPGPGSGASRTRRGAPVLRYCSSRRRLAAATVRHCAATRSVAATNAGWCARCEPRMRSPGLLCLRPGPSP